MHEHAPRAVGDLGACGTALGNGSRLLCSQLQGGCRAGGAGEHRGTPSPAVPPPPWGRAGSPSAWHPFYFRAERPQLRPRYLPAKETAKHPGDSAEGQKYLEADPAPAHANKSSATAFSGSRIRGPEGAAKIFPSSTLRGRSSNSPRDLWKEA